MQSGTERRSSPRSGVGPGRRVRGGRADSWGPGSLAGPHPCRPLRLPRGRRAAPQRCPRPPVGLSFQPLIWREASSCLFSAAPFSRDGCRGSTAPPPSLGLGVLEGPSHHQSSESASCLKASFSHRPQTSFPPSRGAVSPAFPDPVVGRGPQTPKPRAPPSPRGLGKHRPGGLPPGFQLRGRF